MVQARDLALPSISTVVLHGRELELAAIDEVLASARGGRGRALFVTGEAGIGKSSVLAEARARAGGVVLDGAAWESPGAPPYWPWIQVLRAAERRFGARIGALLASLVSGGSSERAAADAVDPAAARFALVDAVARALVDLSADEPLLIVLDDLHAADLPSLELLELLCRDLPRSAIAIVGGWRDSELVGRPDAARRLARAGRHAIVSSLRRLTATEVTTWLGVEGAAIHATTEGNPLFVEEMVRVRRTGGPARGIATALEDHLALVSTETRAVLAAASVLGREVEPALVQALCEHGPDAIEQALREATTAGLGEPRDQRWVFRHVLLRDHLYQSLAPSRRTALHRAAGEALAGVNTASTGAAHHLLAGIVGNDVDRAIAATREAAGRAMRVFAFEDAASLLAAAVRALDATGAGEDSVRIDLRLELARARHAAGAIEAGQADALAAAELSRGAGDAERLARAALAYAAELATGMRDPVMVELLEEARLALPAADGALRARVTARLGAALVPTKLPEDQEPYQLADHAVAMAGRLGDDDTRMFAMRYALHAHGFRLGIEESMPLIREVIALADRLGRSIETIEHRTWVVNAEIVRADPAAVDVAVEPLAALLARLPQPHYRWRMPLLRATRATLRGDFDEAARLIASTRQLAREHELVRARRCCAFAALSLALVSRSAARAEAAVDEVRALVREIAGPVGASILSSVLAAAGQHDEARRVLGTLHFFPPIGLVQFAAEAALLIDDRVTIAGVIPALAQAAGLAPLAYGPSMSLLLCPIEVVIGEGLLRLGRADEAIAPIERGLAIGRRLASPPFIARAAAALAAAVAERARPEDHAQLAALRDEARALIGPDREPTMAAAPASPGLELVRDGEMVRIRWRGRELRVAPTKGLDYLAALVARPSGELHVSDLAGDDDRGDAGEMLDASARAAYKARVEDLRAELDEAQARNDLGRIDRLSAELEMITDQLVASTGLGGRARRAGSRVERARVNVQRRIRDAIRRLAGEDATLGRHLDATIRTGTFCSFTPLDDA